MKIILPILLFAGLTVSAQPGKIEFLPGAEASRSGFFLLPFTGTAANGNTYAAGFTEHYDKNGKPLELEFVRIDLATKNIQYKRLVNVWSGNGFYWTYVFDKDGNVYLSMNTGNRKVIKMNLQDSISCTDIGNPFEKNGVLAYSMSSGRDGNIYFGGSSGGTYWSMYNTKTGKFEKHGRVDEQNDYALSMAADNDYVYVQTGQRTSINLWAVNKKTDEKKILFRVPNTTRISLGAFTDGVYAGISTDTLKATFRLQQGAAVKILTAPVHTDISGMQEQGKAKRRETKTFFDAVESKLYFSFDNKNFQSVAIKTSAVKVPVRRIFSFMGDKENIYYAGDYYGNYYRYNVKEKKSYLLGTTGYNVYSALQVDENKIYLSGYPSGYIMLWDKSKPWTTQRFINGRYVDARDAGANPHILHYWKGEGKPAAGFHHTYQMVKDNKGNIIGAGDVIRIGDAASIGVFNPVTDKIYGINYAPFSFLHFAGLALWKDVVLYSMKSNGAAKPKIYFYNVASNSMKDSIDLGFSDYGKIYVQGDRLTGIASDRIYSVSLTNKKLLWNESFTKGAVSGGYLLHNGTFIINTAAKLPVSMKGFSAVPAGLFHEVNNILYAIKDGAIVQIL